MVSLLNGFSEMGKSISAFAGNAAVEQQKADLEQQQTILANQLREGSETRLAAVQGDESRKTATTTAQEQGKAAIATATAENTLPMSAAQKDASDIQRGTLAETTRHNTIEEEKPVPAGFGAGWVIRTPDGGYKVVDLNGDSNSGGGGGGDKTLNPNSNSIPAQVGLSQGGVDYLLGKNAGRSAGLLAMRQKEVENWAAKHNINVTTLQSQAQGYNKVLEQNIIRNNAMVNSEREIAGSIDTVKDALKDVDISKVNWANVAAFWAGKQVNDPMAITVADQLGRLREEYAGFNMAAQGHMNNNGSVAQADDAALQRAGDVITNGISSGGIDALGKSIQASAAKNHAVLLRTIDDTNEEMFNLFGAKYHRPNAPDAAPPPDGAATPPPADGTAAPGGTTTPPPAKRVPDPAIQKQITADTIKSTAQKRGISEDQVKKELKALGYTVPQ